MPELRSSEPDDIDFQDDECCSSAGITDSDGTPCHSLGCPMVDWSFDPPVLKKTNAA